MRNKSGKTILGCVILTVGFLFIAYGIMSGEVITVFNKAVNICMECIGIG